MARQRSRLQTNYPGSEYTPAEVEFMQAMSRYKREYHRPYPTCAEVLEVARALGYRRIEPADTAKRGTP